MLTGSQTLSSIDQALADLRRQESQLDIQIEEATHAITRARDDQTEAYRELARFRLNTEAAAALDARIDEAAREARQALDAREKARQVLARELEDKQVRRDALQAELRNLMSERETMAGRMDALMEAVDDTLEKDPAFQAQKTAAEASAHTAEAARDKATMSRKDREEKGKAYEADPLFLYLWHRDFGTPKYDRRGLIRALDRWVAGLINFQDARANYAMLTSIPDRMAEHAERCAATARAEADRLAQLSRQALSEAAGEDLVARIDEITDRIEAQGRVAAAQDQSIDTVSQALKSFSDGEDAHFKKAETSFSTSLQSDDLKDLWRHALATPSKDDEKIVERIESLRKQVENRELDIRINREKRQALAERRAELAEVVKTFRRNGYDNWDSTFDDNSLTTVLLGELIRGAISGADYLARARKSHRIRRPRGGRQGFPGGHGLPRSMGGGFSGRGLGGEANRKSGWGPGSSGGFGGGGFKSGKSFGGGGFKTGDTF